MLSLIWREKKLCQIPFAGFDAEAGFEKVHLLVGDGVDEGQVGDLHVGFGGLFGGLDEAEGLVEVTARAVDAVRGPDD